MSDNSIPIYSTSTNNACSITTHIRQDWFYHFLSQWVDFEMLRSLDAALTSHRIRNDWLVQIRRLPPAIFESIKYTHSSLRWIIDRHITSIQKLTISNSDPSLRSSSFIGCHWPRLHHIDLRHTRHQALKTTSPFPSNGHLPIEAITHISASCRDLRAMFLVGSTLHATYGEDVFRTILTNLAQRCTRIEVMCIEQCGKLLLDTHLLLLPLFSTLQELTLHGASSLSDDGIVALCACKPNPISLLRSINLSQCSLLSSISILAIARVCSCLEVLGLADCPLVGSEAITAIAISNPRLHSVVLNRCYLLNDQAALTLFSCSALTFLCIKGCVNVSAGIVAHLRQSNREPPLRVVV